MLIRFHGDYRDVLEYVPVLGGPVMEAEGIKWDDADVVRFLSKVKVVPNPVGHDHCLEWTGGKSRGTGKLEYYGSFYTKGKTVRAHVFSSLAILGLRRAKGQQLDHECANSLCVYHLNPICGRLNASYSRGGQGRMI